MCHSSPTGKGWKKIMNEEWQVIVNRVTCRTGWRRWCRFLEKNEIVFTLHHSFTLEESQQVLHTLYQVGQRRFLFVGGDGTLHYGLNTLLQIAGDQSYDVTVGLLPCGTGNDWWRTFGLRKDQLAAGLREGYTAPVNVVKVTWPDGRMRYGINMVGGALDASVVQTLKRKPVIIPSFIIYPLGLFISLMKPHVWKGHIIVDEHRLEGRWLTLQAGFGKYCGGGMKVLPHAREDAPGILLMKPRSLFNILWSSRQIYSGEIIHHPQAWFQHFETITVDHHETPIPIEADGEFLGYSPVRLEACFDVMKRVV
jgi:diacylglycerol kinase family enzyme